MRLSSVTDGDRLASSTTSSRLASLADGERIAVGDDMDLNANKIYSLSDYGGHSSDEAGYSEFDNSYAIEAAQTAMEYTGTLVIPDGTWYFTRPIKIGVHADDSTARQDIDFHIVGTGTVTLRKTGTTADPEGQDSIIYMGNAVRCGVHNLSIKGAGWDAEGYGINARYAWRSNHIDRVSFSTLGTCLDVAKSTWGLTATDIYFHTCKQFIEVSNEATHTCMHFDRIIGGNMWTFGRINRFDKSYIGKIAIDGVNCSTGYSENISLDPATYAIMFYLTKETKVVHLSTEGCDTKSFLRLGASSVDVDFIELFNMQNSGDAYAANSDNPIVAHWSAVAALDCHFGRVAISGTSPSHLCYFPYLSATYGYYTRELYTFDSTPSTMTVVDAGGTGNNSEVMVKYPGSAHPLYWADDGTPAQITVANDNSVTATAVSYDAEP